MEESELFKKYEVLVNGLNNSEVVIKGSGAVEGKSMDLNLIEQKLNEKKKMTGELMHRKRWRTHTEWTHPLGKDMTFQYQNPTRAYLKMTDLLMRFPQLATGKYQKLRSLHLCESPGNFVAALGDYLGDKPWEWRMNSLNPYYEWNEPSSMLTSDALVISNDSRMFFGANNSGDVFRMTKEDIDGIGKVDLVTADGSFDCTGDPENQEELVLNLISREAFLAVNALNVGGHLVVKFFTLFLPKTREIMMRLIGSFEEVYLRKPVPSKPGNSEVYLVCLNYCGEPRMEISEETFQKIQSAACFFASRQMEAIDINLHTMCASQFLRCQVDEIKQNFAREWFDKAPEQRFWDEHASKRPLFPAYRIPISPQSIQLSTSPFISFEWLKSRKFIVVPKEAVRDKGQISNPLFDRFDPTKLKLDFCALAGQKIAEMELPPSASGVIIGITPWNLTKRALIDKILVILCDAEKVIVSPSSPFECGVLSRFSVSVLAVLLDIFELDGLPIPGGAILLKRQRPTPQLMTSLMNDARRDQMVAEVLCFVSLNDLSDNFRQFLRFYNGQTD